MLGVIRFLSVLVLALNALPGRSEQVGHVAVDWIGNDVRIKALPDPNVAGVTCHMAHFDRATPDRLMQGSWFEDPSNSSIACRQTGPITLGDIARARGRGDGPRKPVAFAENPARDAHP